MKFCDADTPGAYGGYYTKEEIREIVRYADSLHINVIPEFELPAHSEAVFSAYPELNCTNSSAGNGEFCPANEEFYRFAEGVLTEIMELSRQRSSISGRTRRERQHGKPARTATL